MVEGLPLVFLRDRSGMRCICFILCPRIVVLLLPWPRQEKTLEFIVLVISGLAEVACSRDSFHVESPENMGRDCRISSRWIYQSPQFWSDTASTSVSGLSLDVFTPFRGLITNDLASAHMGGVLALEFYDLSRAGPYPPRAAKC
jgi:hypothetical protein